MAPHDGTGLRAGRSSCYAIAAPGLEGLVAAELVALGIKGERDVGGVAFQATRRELYRANLELRLASRVLVRVGEFRATAFWELEKRARTIPWPLLVAPNRAVAFRVTSKKSTS